MKFMKIRNGMGKYHGSAWDRGSADSWYSRPKNPHYYPEGSYNGDPVTEKDMVQGELDSYNRGYDENEAMGEHKDWG